MESIIFKYAIEPGENALWMPVGAKPLAFEFQGGLPHIWCQIPTQSIDEELYEDRIVKVVMTGEHFDDGGFEYVGTSLKMMYVYHVYMSK